MGLESKQRILSEKAIVRAVADEACRRCVNSVRRSLQQMPAGLLGDAFTLNSVWEEICVQVQSDRSFPWRVYDETMRLGVDSAVEELASYEREAVWLQTDAAWEWEHAEDAERHPYPVAASDIISFIMEDHLLPEARRWSNSRIRAFIDYPSS